MCCRFLFLRTRHFGGAVTSLYVTAQHPGGFEDWYRQSRPRVLATVVVAFGNLDAATDATDEAFTRAYARWGRVGAMESPIAWTTKVALNHARRKGRRKAIEQRILRKTATDSTMPGIAGEAWSAVSQLPDRQREVVVLRYVTDLPEADIARTLGISRSTVSSALTDARRALRITLSDPWEPQPAPRAPTPGAPLRPCVDSTELRTATATLASEASND